MHLQSLHFKSHMTKWYLYHEYVYRGCNERLNDIAMLYLNVITRSVSFVAHLQQYRQRQTHKHAPGICKSEYGCTGSARLVTPICSDSSQVTSLLQLMAACTK